ncbi:MAG: glycosyltransferase family 39 protein [Anaerolineae bacterium]
MGGFTIEAAAYAAVCLLALGLRLPALGTAPLSPDEAQQALAAYRLAQGDPTGAQQLGAVAPALVALQALVFSLFGNNDALARLPVVLATALSPLALWMLRPVLGRPQSLLAALLLALSPFWAVHGSMGLGQGLAGAALLFGLGFAVRYAQGGDRYWALAAGVAWGAALGSAADAWAAAVLAVVVWLALRRPSPFVHPAARSSLGLGLAAGAILLSTTGLFHPAGLQSLLDLGGTLVSGFFRREPGALTRQVLVLVFYEPLLLLPALGTMALVPPRDVVHKALYLWTAGSLLLTLLSGTPGTGLALALPALAVLSAEAILAIGSRVAALDGRLRLEGAAVGAVLLGYGAVALAGLAQKEDTVFLLLVLTAVGVGLALLGLLLVRNGPQAAAALAASLLLVVLGLWSLSGTIQGVVSRQGLAQEALRTSVSTSGITDLVQDVTDLSWSRLGYGNELAVTAQSDVGPAVAWYLRGLRSLTWVDAVGGDTDAPALLTAGTELELSTESYTGQSYAVAGRWQPRFANAGAFLRWLLYRDVPTSDIEWQKVGLWVRTEGN